MPPNSRSGGKCEDRNLSNPRLSELWRGPGRESFHRGALAVVRGEQVLLRLGNADEKMYPRSALKAFQALPVLAAGLDRFHGLNAAQITLLNASHSGDSGHVREVRGMLARAGIPEDALGCGAHVPYDLDAAADLIRANREPEAVHNNCSGKHAGMLMLADHLGAPRDSYLDPEHPVQRLIRQELALFAGVPAASLTCGRDGCAAPAWSLTLVELARAQARFARPRGLAVPREGACQRLFAAVQKSPHFLCGRDILDGHLIRAGEGRVYCKRGAEGVLALAVAPASPDDPGLGIALKVDDGNPRGYALPAVFLLRALGVPLRGLEDDLSEQLRGVERNHAGKRIGEMKLAPEFRKIVEEPLRELRP